jgi:HSP20 family molecular chaperone IbpA
MPYPSFNQNITTKLFTMTTMQTIKRRVEMVPLASMEKTIGNSGKPVLQPVINVDETDEEYIIYMSMPGLRRENLGITVGKGLLTISVGIKENEKDFEDHCDYDYYGWSRTYQLPGDADSLMTTAAFRYGELVIRIPRTEAEIHAEPLLIHVY